MQYVIIKCSHCKKKVARLLSHRNEALKHNWRQYCSRACMGRSKIKNVEAVCANPTCKRKFVRQLCQASKTTSGNMFCSRSCAATVNNSLRQKKYHLVKCALLKCQGNIPNNQIYCSRNCASLGRRRKIESARNEVQFALRDFHRTHNRIPMKRELPNLYRKARQAFGTWNKALENSGLTPNPLLFARKHVAKDGHICDSLSEKIIDDWFSKRGIPHATNVPYPSAPELTCDFVVGQYFIEFFGLDGIHHRYTELAQKSLDT